ncbi:MULTISPECIES: GAF domain-containing protein [Streptomyces]|uniref:GAF domain-containing protein n=1 Tax=Streptomyces TaxID=1883 RepID=UPI0016430E61|nr:MULTISPECIES: GAF domain-containing protein [Streptomyces]MBT3073558.1 GAF domain-containing protein [Streptomyces sp. COG21]MBT3083469.1 GAF domain-containing protein [Streptomyces sp. COG20]MBT3088473.1 GAF domain-containing protein [Streptomyces sp. CYG21]MBT3098285.1 GAF domain-containing protein [Streptomyces sp. CBG30]MBT3101892.1 GAF domain-containing protein [Streptomyces sp. COG19]
MTPKSDSALSLSTPSPAAPSPTVSASDAHRDELLQSVVDVARAIFGAAAGSVLLLDEEADELVFRAVSGEGQEFLVGRRFPAGRGIAGWVATSGEPMVVDDLADDPSFDRSLAESTEYVPNSLMAAPLISDSRVLGVLEVLDASPQARSSVRELDLLAMFARQAAAALRVITPEPVAAAPAARPLEGTEREDALRLLGSLEQVLRGTA